MGNITLRFDDEESVERFARAMLAQNRRLEDENKELKRRLKAEPPSPEVIRKLELDLDTDDQVKLERVLKGVEVCLEQAREKLLKARQLSRAQDCEARRVEVITILRMLGERK